jgi:predicted secreted Zn-dependent protease
MASIAVVTEIAAMDIILFVAAAAGRRLADLFSHGGTVAGDAVEALMRAVQRIVRLLVVVERPQCPAIRVVTVPRRSRCSSSLL